jgi:hypothetical protein
MNPVQADPFPRCRHDSWQTSRLHPTKGGGGKLEITCDFQLGRPPEGPSRLHRTWRCMLSSVLHSERAVRMNISLSIRVFVRPREMIAHHPDMPPF